MRLQQMPRYHWHLCVWPDNGGTMPGESHVFTTRVDPVSPPESPRRNAGRRRGLVEAPGTAPGSATLIPHHVYRHSRFPDTLNIGIFRPLGKGVERAEKRDGGPGRPPPVGRAGPPRGACPRHRRFRAGQPGRGDRRALRRRRERVQCVWKAAKGTIQITAHETVSGSHASRSRERYPQG